MATRGDSSSLQVAATSITGVDTASDLSAQIADINVVSQRGPGGGVHYSITLAPGRTLIEAADITAIHLKGTDTLTIDGAGSALDGAGAYRGFTVITGHVTFANLTIENTLAKGGDGGGGGAGQSFVFHPGFHRAQITDFHLYLSGVNHDTLQFAQAQFADFDALLRATTDGADGAVITAPNGDQLLLALVTKAMVSAHPADFSFL